MDSLSAACLLLRLSLLTLAAPRACRRLHALLAAASRVAIEIGYLGGYLDSCLPDR